MREDAITTCGAAADAAPLTWVKRVRDFSPWPLFLSTLVLITDVVILAFFVLAATSLLVSR